jgi:hypothetical protein
MRQSVDVNLQHLVPHISFNFGTRDGWSYLSAGMGSSAVTTRTGEVDPADHETGRLRSFHFGGGARWFLKSRLAFGFDVRFYQVDNGQSGEPRKTFLTVGAGFSLR